MRALFAAALLAVMPGCRRTATGEICPNQTVRNVTLFAADVPVRRWDGACFEIAEQGSPCFTVWTKESGYVTACGTYVASEK